MYQPLFQASCAQGKLTITETMISVERGPLTSASMPRAMFAGLESRMTLLFPFLTRYRLTLHSTGGQRIIVSNVSARNAKRIKMILRGY